MLSRDELIILISEFLEDNFKEELQKDDFSAIMNRESARDRLMELASILDKNGYSNKALLANVFAIPRLIDKMLFIVYIFFKTELDIELPFDESSDWHGAFRCVISKESQQLIENKQLQIHVPSECDTIGLYTFDPDLFVSSGVLEFDVIDPAHTDVLDYVNTRYTPIQKLKWRLI